MAPDLNDTLREKGDDGVRERLDKNRKPGPKPKGKASPNGADQDSNRESPGQKAKRKKPLAPIYNMAELRKKQFDPLKSVVGEIIVEGLTFLCAASKVGKTTMMLDCATAVANGGITLGDIECTKGDVLYLSLEMGERSIQPSHDQAARRTGAGMAADQHRLRMAARQRGRPRRP